MTARNKSSDPVFFGFPVYFRSFQSTDATQKILACSGETTSKNERRIWRVYWKACAKPSPADMAPDDSVKEFAVGGGLTVVE